MENFIKSSADISSKNTDGESDDEVEEESNESSSQAGKYRVQVLMDTPDDGNALVRGYFHDLTELNLTMRNNRTHNPDQPHSLRRKGNVCLRLRRDARRSKKNELLYNHLWYF